MVWACLQFLNWFTKSVNYRKPFYFVQPIKNIKLSLNMIEIILIRKPHIWHN